MNKDPKQNILEKEKQPAVIRQWLTLNKILSNYRWGMLLVSLLSLVLAAFLYLQVQVDPVVVIYGPQGKISLSGAHAQDEISDKDIDDFIREFIERRYRWPAFSPQTIIHDLRDLASQGFLQKLSALLEKEEKSLGEGKKMSQDVSGLFVEIGEKSISAFFDRVLRISGIPFVAPTEAQIEIREGRRSPANPWGLYVTGFIEKSLQ